MAKETERQGNEYGIVWAVFNDDKEVVKSGFKTQQDAVDWSKSDEGENVLQEVGEAFTIERVEEGDIVGPEDEDVG